MNNFIRFCFIIIIFSSISFAQFSSVQNGKWYWASTWSTDPNATAIPDSNDNVVVYHDVNLDGGGRCNNLTIEAGGRIHNGGLGVFGSVINNGTIDGLGEWSGMTINLRGNLTNYGKFESQMNFEGNADQTILSTDSIKFAYGYDRDPNSRLIIENSITFYDSFIFLNGAELFLNDDITLVESGIDGGLVDGNFQSIYGKLGEIGWGHAVGFGPQKTTLRNVTLDGTLGFYGSGEDGVWATIIDENVINNGTIYNQYLNGGGRAWVYINSDFENNGTIQEQQSGMTLYFRGQDFANNGSFSSGTLSFIGTADQSLSIPDISKFTPTSVEMYSDKEGSSYQWQKDGSDILNAVSNGYTLWGFSESDQGMYQCVVDGANLSREITLGQSAVPQEVLLLEQNFDSQNEVADWRITGQNQTNTWVLGNIPNANFNLIEPSSLYSAICPYDANNSQDEFLISPAFSIGSGNATLKFYAGYNSAWTSNAHLQVMITLNDGQSWEKLWEYNLTTNGWEWNEVTIDLSQYANTAHVKLAWEYIGLDGDVVAVDKVEVNGYEFVTNVEPEEQVVKKFSLSQNYPNPFNPSTKIEYVIPENGNVKLVLYDALGREVKTIVAGYLTAGSYDAALNAAGLSSGTYFYRLTSGSYTETRKMVILK